MISATATSSEEIRDGDDSFYLSGDEELENEVSVMLVIWKIMVVKLIFLLSHL